MECFIFVMLICDTLINYYLLTVMIREYFGQMQSNNSYRGYKQNNSVKSRLEMKERTVLQKKKENKKSLTSSCLLKDGNKYGFHFFTN